jgi:class 3 adenylate cyclase
MPGQRERKVVTALFADLAGFTSRAEEMDPEDVAALLDPYHARLKSELERFGGTVEKFIGDAVMAIFGAPVAHEDDAERAVRAALAIRDWSEEEKIELRVGVNTGEALVTLGASPSAGESMAAGDVVNTAARLQAAAPVGGILVGEQTFRATERAIEFAKADPVEAKGKAEPVATWRALAARARPHVEHVQGAELVGRQRELALLGGALDRARQERSPELVTLIGVPGIGKSRLVLELYGQIERESEFTSWRHGRCLPYGEGITFWALGEMVKSEAGILEGDSETEAEQKLATVVHDPWIERHLRPLVGLSGGAGGEGERRDEAFTAWRRFFEGLADERPLVLVFEDLHWADENLLDFVDHLVEWASGVPLLVVCTARPELLNRRPGWGGGKPNTLSISLSPLSDDETARLLAKLLERSVLPAETQTQLLAQAGGNPLYAEEYARMLRERGGVEELPETVQGLIAARLDLLEPDQKRIIQNAAVVGKTFWIGALTSLLELDRSSLEEWLHALARKEFVRRERSSSLAGDAEYTFRHLLVRDVAYGQLPRAERAEKHQRTAAWFERLGRPEDHAEMLAYHYLQALEIGTAAGLNTQAFSEPAQAALADAGDRAFSLNAFDAAARYYRAAIDLLPAGNARRGRLLLRLGRALWLYNEPALELFESAKEELLAAGDVEGAGDAETRLAEHFWLAGDREEAFAHLERAREMTEALPSSRVKAHATATASRFRMLASDDTEAIRLGSEAIAMAEELGLDEVRAAALNNVGSARAARGDDQGLADLAEAARIAEAANAGFELSRARGNLATQLWLQGRLAEAFSLWQQAEEDTVRFGQLSFKRWMQGVVIYPLYVVGEWAKALSRAEAFIAEIESGSPHYLACVGYFTRGLIRLGRGEAASAVVDGEEALTLAARAADPQQVVPTNASVAHIYCELERKERAGSLVDDSLSALEGLDSIGFAGTSMHMLSWTLAALGREQDLAAAQGELSVPWAQAASAFAAGDPVEAAQICSAIGAQTEEAYARLSAARMLLGQGRRAEADAQLRPALEFYRSVGAAHYIRQGESLMAASA